MSCYLEGMQELRLTANIQNDHCHRAEEQRRAEAERKELAAQLSKAMEARTVAEDLLMIKQERADDLSQDLAVLLEQRGTTEKI